MSKWSLICSAVDKRQQSSGYAPINAVSFLITLNHLPSSTMTFLFTHLQSRPVYPCGDMRLWAPTTFEEVVLVCLFQHYSKFYPHSHVSVHRHSQFSDFSNFSARKLKEWNNVRNFKTADRSYLSEVQINRVLWWDLYISECAFYWNPIRCEAE